MATLNSYLVTEGMDVTLGDHNVVVQDLNTLATLKRAARQEGTTLSSVTGGSTDVSDLLSEKIPGGGDTAVGIVTTAPNNKVTLVYASGAQQGLMPLDATTGNRVYARVTYASNEWTLRYYTTDGMDMEIPYSFSAEVDLLWYYWEVYTLLGSPIFPVAANIISDQVAATIADTSYTVKGKSAPKAVGGLPVGGILVSNGLLELAPAKTVAAATQLGGVKVGANILVDANGVISLDNTSVANALGWAPFKYSDSFNDYVVSGLLPAVPGSGLTTTTPAGVAYVGDKRPSTINTTFTYLNEADTYVDLKSDGTFRYTTRAISASAPGVSAGELRLFMVRATGGNIIAVTDLRNLALKTTQVVDAGALKVGGVQVINSAREVRSSAVGLGYSNEIWPTASNSLYISWRDQTESTTGGTVTTIIGTGKGQAIATFSGADKSTSLTGALNVGGKTVIDAAGNIVSGGSGVFTSGAFEAIVINAAGTHLKFQEGGVDKWVVESASGALKLGSSLTLEASGAHVNVVSGSFKMNGTVVIDTSRNITAGAISGSTGTFTGLVLTPLSAAGGAGFRLPHGAAPTTPVDGDTWTTTAGVFAHISGASQQMLHSVGLSLPAIFSVTTGTVNAGSGTLTATLSTQSANTVFAGPSSGGAVAPGFRSLVKLDLPSVVAYTDAANTFSATQTVASGYNLNVVNGLYQVGGTTIIDAAKNLSNIGTVSSGQHTITTAFAAAPGSSSQLVLFDSTAFAQDVGASIALQGWRDGTAGSQTTFGSVKAGKVNATSGDGTGYLALYARSSSAAAEILRLTTGTGADIKTGGLAVGGTIVIDSSRSVSAVAGTFTGAVTGASFNSITGLASGNGTALGTAAPGTSTLTARQDHVHPTTGLALLAGATFTGTVITPVSATTGAGFRLPHGAAPTAPVNGDLWTTTSGLYVQINSNTCQMLYSVGLSLPAEFTVSTGTVNAGSGTLTATWANQTANKFFASPNGSTGAPAYRAIVAADLPVATTGAQGVLQVGANLTVTTGTLSLTGANVISALGYTPSSSASPSFTGSISAPNYYSILTPGSGSTGSGYWYPIATVNITAQYHDAAATLRISSNGQSGGTGASYADLIFRVKQQNVMGGVPSVQLNASTIVNAGAALFSPSDFVFVLTRNDAAATAGTLYARNNVTFEQLVVTVLGAFSSTTSTFALSGGAGVAALPAGTQTAATGGIVSTGSTVNLPSGKLQIGGSDVIDASRNFTGGSVTAAAGTFTSAASLVLAATFNNGTDPATGLSIYAYSATDTTPYLQSTGMLYASASTTNLQYAAVHTSGVHRWHVGGFNATTSEKMRLNTNGLRIGYTADQTTGGAAAADKLQVGGSAYFSGAVVAASFNGATGLASAAPLALGTAAVGVSTLAARENHVHPTTGLALLAGATFTGKVNTTASTSTAAGLNIGNGAAPNTGNFVAGDVWGTSAGLFYRASAATQQMLYSVGLSLPTELAVSTATVNAGSGTLTAAWADQTANMVFASPTGSAGAPTFRALVAADLPSGLALLGGTNAWSAANTFSANVTIGSTLLLADVTNGRVSVGTASGVSKLHVYEDTAATDTTNGITIEQKGAGDASLQFLTTGVQRWQFGIDNSDSDKLKISAGTALGNATTYLELTNTGVAVLNSTLSTDSSGAGGHTFITTLTKNDALTKAFKGVSIKPTINTGASNTTTTLEVLSIDTTNTATTGMTTVVLLSASYGGSPRMSLSSTGQLSLYGDVYLSSGADRQVMLGTELPDSPGRTLSIKAGSTSTSSFASNVPGGDLDLYSGLSTGSADSRVEFWTPTPGASGKAVNSYASRGYVYSGGMYLAGSLWLRGSGDSLNMTATAAGTPGTALAIRGGSTTSGSANIAGGALQLYSGQSTGNATSRIEFHTATPGITGVGSLNATAMRAYVDSTSLNLTVPVTFADSTAYVMNFSGATNWGVYWDTVNNQLQFHGAGVNKAHIDLDDGSAMFAGDISLTKAGPVIDSPNGFLDLRATASSYNNGIILRRSSASTGVWANIGMYSDTELFLGANSATTGMRISQLGDLVTSRNITSGGNITASSGQLSVQSSVNFATGLNSISNTSVSGKPTMYFNLGSDSSPSPTGGDFVFSTMNGFVVTINGRGNITAAGTLSLGDRTFFRQYSNAPVLSRNAVNNGAGWVRTTAENVATLIELGSIGEFSIFSATDAGNTAGSAITLSTPFRVLKGGDVQVNGTTVISSNRTITAFALIVGGSGVIDSSQNILAASYSVNGVGTVINSSGQLVTEAWITPTLLNNWLNYTDGGGPYNPVSYYKDKTGRVYIRGIVYNGSLNTSIFTLPAGYRPAYNTILMAISNDAVGRVDILPSGTVRVNKYNGGWLVLDNLSFRAEA